jgi:hypothetical protein
MTGRTENLLEKVCLEVAEDGKMAVRNILQGNYLSRHDIMYIGNKCKKFKFKKFKLLIYAATINKIVKFVT